ncbi:MAG: hypothetical protein V5A32_05320 [Halovenus sp.]
MVEPTEIFLGSVVLVVALWYGYRALSAGLLSRSLSGTDSYSSTGMVDGETAAVEGEVIVDEPVDTAGMDLTTVDTPLAALVWRGKYPESGNDYTIDFENRSLERKMQTFASGIESGTFRIDDGRQQITVDPGWLAETHDSAALSELSLEGVQTSTPLSNRTWASPSIHLTDHVSERTFDETDGLVDEDVADADPSRHYFESKAISEGDTLAVRGEVQIDQGEPVIRGTEETPLAISDTGFDGLGADLRGQMIKYGALLVSLLAVSSVLLLRGGGVL